MDNKEDIGFLVYSFTTTLDSWETQDSLIALFNEGVNQSTAALGYARTLTYLIKAYLGFEKTENFKRYEGYMVKTPKDISAYTQIPYDTCKTQIKCLQSMGFIEVRTGASKNKTCIKVCLEKIAEESSRISLQRKDFLLNYVNSSNELSNNYAELFAIDIGELTEEKVEDLKEKGFDYDEMVIVYSIGKRYREITGRYYPWNKAEINNFRAYFGKGHILSDYDLKEIEEAIKTLDQLTFQKRAHLSTRIIGRIKGVHDFYKKT